MSNIAGTELVAVKVSPLNIPSSPQMITEYAEKLTDVMHMEDIKKVVDAFKEQDELLSKAKEYSELRAKYAALEAATYKKIVDKGWDSALGSPNSYVLKAARWLAEQDEKSYERCIQTILNSSKGATIISLWRESITIPKYVNSTRDAIGLKRESVDIYDERGYVELDWYYHDHFEEFADYVTNDSDPVPMDEYERRYSDKERQQGNRKWIRHEKIMLDKHAAEVEQMALDSTRIALRKRGAVGIGHGIYVNPDTHPEYISKAIAIRKGNIAACILRLKELCDQSTNHVFMQELIEALKLTDNQSVINAISNHAQDLAVTFA